MTETTRALNILYTLSKDQYDKLFGQESGQESHGSEAALVNTLTHREHQVITLRFRLGYTIRDTAKELGISYETARNDLKKVLTKLESALVPKDIT